MGEMERASTAEGPRSDAVIAASGSVVLRHEQDGGFDFAPEWCIGHICPSSCAHVHSIPVARSGIVRRSAVGIDIRTEN